MSLIFCDSFDHYYGLYPSNVSNCLSAKGWINFGGVYFQNGRINNSGYSVYLNAGNQNSMYRYCDNSQKSPWITVGTAFWHGGNFPNNGGNNQHGQIQFINATTNTNFCFIQFDGNGNLTLYNGSNTLLAVVYGAYASTAAGWNYIEMQSLVSNTGYVQININGNPVIYWTGQTNNGGSDNNVNQVTLLSFSNGYNRGINFDDFYWNSNTGNYCTGFLGDIRIIPSYPNGSGITSQLSGSSGNSPNINWTNTNNYSGSTGTFNYGYISGEEDTYSFSGLGYLNPSLPSIFAQVYGVQLNVLAMKADGGTRSIVPVALRSGIYSTGINSFLANIPSYICAPFSADFANSGQLTESGISGTYFGVRIIQ